MGYQCDRRHGLHVPIDRVVVQVARLGRPDTSAGPGELGEGIVTSLLRTTTPFIRYRIGDVAIWDDSAYRLREAAVPRDGAIAGETATPPRRR